MPPIDRLKLASDTVAEGNFSLLIALFHELLLGCLASILPPPMAAEIIQQILDLPSPNVVHIFLHTYSLYTPNQQLLDMMNLLKIDKSLLLLLLEPSTLIDIGCAHQMFGKRIVRTNTNMLYKQKRFNLLREESEGYSKLIVEIYTTAYSRKNMQQVDSTASAIVSLIGYFDLDPIRTLDVFLDICAMNFVAHASFFIAVLKKSPWWPSTPCTPTSLDSICEGGNNMAVQLLGFKLKSLAANGDSTPENLLMLIAVLIKEGFISLGGIYPFLDPPDDVLKELHEKWKSDMDERAFLATASALALAAPLTDDTDMPLSQNQQQQKQTQETTAEPKTNPDGSIKYPSFQKVGLLNALLSVGSLYPSLFLLAKFPFVVDPYPEIADLIHRIFEYSIETLYEHHGKPLDTNSLPPFRPRKLPSSSVRELNLVEASLPPITKGLSCLPRVTEPSSAQFFYDNWNSSLKQIDDLDSLSRFSDLLLRFSGPLLSRHVTLLVKLCRIGVSYCKNNKDNVEIISYWTEYFRNHILPVVSLLPPNPGAIQEVYSLLRFFSFETRYSLYGEWQAVLLKSSPHLKFASSKAEKETKNVLKRLSNTNVKEMMRRLAKISYSNPLTSFTVFIGQVESYDNLGGLVVEAARYFTDMGWDVFPYIIMLQLTSGRGTQQMDGLNDRKWIQCKFKIFLFCRTNKTALASFTAKLCRRYGYMDPKPLLSFLLRQLHVNDLSFIIVLRELITHMGGIAQLSNLNSKQVENLGAGPILRSKVFESIEDGRESAGKSGKRLMDAIISLGIFGELFILLNQVHTRFIYNVPEELAYEKVLASRYDDLTHILIQFTEMSNYYLDIEVFKKNMLPISRLCIDYGVSVPCAFGIWRQYLGEEIRGFLKGSKTSDTEMTDISNEASNDDDENLEVSQLLI